MKNSCHEGVLAARLFQPAEKCGLGKFPAIASTIPVRGKPRKNFPPPCATLSLRFENVSFVSYRDEMSCSKVEGLF